MIYQITGDQILQQYLPPSNIEGWLAHLARHVPRNTKVKYDVCSSLIGIRS